MFPARSRPLPAAALGSGGDGWEQLQGVKIQSLFAVPVLESPLISGLPLPSSSALRSEVSVPLRCSWDRTRRLLILHVDCGSSSPALLWGKIKIIK